MWKNYRYYVILHTSNTLLKIVIHLMQNHLMKKEYICILYEYLKKAALYIYSVSWNKNS